MLQPSGEKWVVLLRDGRKAGGLASYSLFSSLPDELRAARAAKEI